MPDILPTLAGLTLGGSAAILALSLVSRSTRLRYGARWRCWAWLLLGLRLAVPVPLLPHTHTGAPIRVDLPDPPAVTLPSAVPNSPNVPEAGDTSDSPDSAQGQPSQPAPSESTSSPAPQAPERALDPARLVLGLWLLGAGAMLARNAAAHWRFLRYLHRWSAPVTDRDAIAAFNRLGDQLGLDRRPRLLVCQGLKVPMLAGLLRPAILLPRGQATGEALGLSLLHELTHFRRRDIWLKALALWVNALHWFNPLMWYMVRLVERDTELACDEDVLRRLPKSSYAAYGQTILDAVAGLQDKERKPL